MLSFFQLSTIGGLQKQLDDFEKEWKDFLESAGEGGIAGLAQNLKSMKNDVENLSRAFSKMMADRQESELAMRVSFSNITHDGLQRKALFLVLVLLSQCNSFLERVPRNGIFETS